MRKIDKGPDIGHIVSAAEQIKESPETTDDMIASSNRGGDGTHIMMTTIPK